MLLLNDYRCEQCSFIHESLESSGTTRVACPRCKGNAYLTITQSHVHGCESFNPHYDLQLGRFFQTAEEKKAFLKQTGRTQISGSLSPRKSGKGRWLCTRKQAALWDKPHGLDTVDIGTA